MNKQKQKLGPAVRAACKNLFPINNAPPNAPTACKSKCWKKNKLNRGISKVFFKATKYIHTSSIAAGKERKQKKKNAAHRVISKIYLVFIPHLFFSLQIPSFFFASFSQLVHLLSTFRNCALCEGKNVLKKNLNMNFYARIKREYFRSVTDRHKTRLLHI